MSQFLTRLLIFFSFLVLFSNSTPAIDARWRVMMSNFRRLGMHMSSFGGCHSPNMEECGDLFEGDIVLGEQNNLFPSFETKSVVADDSLLWPNATVPYQIDPSANFDATERKTIIQAIETFQKASCVQWRPRNAFEPDYASFTRKNAGCYSNVGRQKGAQEISLASGCVKVGTIMHEMLHVVGFYHEHSRYDRDDYIDVIWKNVKDGKRHNFKKHILQEEMRKLGPYDYGSIMHYSNKAFAEQAHFGIPKDTIIPKVASARIGQRNALSTIDIWKLKKLYNCPGTSPTPPFHLKPIKEKEKTIRLPIQADFEWNYGHFYQDYDTDHIDWERHIGATDSTGTGPSGDHSTGQGTYIYMESSAPAKSGFKAKLWSSMIEHSGSGSFCIQFWYHMYGENMGVLSVFLKEKFASQPNRLWSISGNQGDAWFVMYLPARCNNNCQVIFEGTLGTGFASDIALDDITIYSGQCNSNPVVGRLLPYFCDFSLSTCGFMQSPSDTIDAHDKWTRWNGVWDFSKETVVETMEETIVGTVKQATDLSATKKYAMYSFDASSALNVRSTLMAPKFNGSGERCLKFRHGMGLVGFQSAMSWRPQLKVYLSHEFGMESSHISISVKQEVNPDNWEEESISIPDFPPEARIMFESDWTKPLGARQEASTGIRSWIGVGNVNVTKGLCEVIVTESERSTTVAQPRPITATERRTTVHSATRYPSTASDLSKSMRTEIITFKPSHETMKTTIYTFKTQPLSTFRWRFTTRQPPSSPDGKLSGGAIAGIVIGSIAGVALIVGLILGLTLN